MTHGDAMELSAPDVPSREQGRGFLFEGFDGLRAIAAIAVAITHSAFISGFNIRNDTWGPYTARLDIGVAVFFVISGFLLYRPFVLARFRNSSGPATLPFFRRRFLRPLRFPSSCACLIESGWRKIDSGLPSPIS